MLRRLALRVLPALALSSAVLAQWSHDPAVNLGISTATSDQNQAKLLSRDDGGTWVVWLDGIGSGWDTRIQRLDAHGVPQFPGNGVLVSDTNYSSTQDYGAAIGADGSAFVAYREGSPTVIHVQKILADGTLAWPGGVPVSDASGGNAPHCCATSDGGVIAAWSNNAGAAALQKVDADGAVQWAAGGVTDVAGTGIYFVNDVVSDGAGGAIASYHHQTGGFSSPRHIKAQRFAAADGAKLWNAGSPLVVFDAGSLQLGNFPALVADGSGGFVTAWYSTAGTRNAYVQHVTADGTELLPHNGLAIAADVAGRIRISASASFDAASGDIHMISTESSSPSQGNYTVIAQRITAAGSRAWGDTAVTLIPQGADQPSFPQCIPVAGGGGVFAWANGGFNAQNVLASRLDPKGNFAWSDEIVTASSVVSGKARLASARGADAGALVLAWADNRTDGNDIYGQRVNLDGTLGTPGDVNDDGVVNFDDLLALLAAWGDCPAPPTFCPADLNGSGTVDFADLLVVLANWG